MDANLKAQWLEALRSGEYEQTTGFLHDDNGYCCLGVLCEVHPEDAFGFDPERHEYRAYYKGGSTVSMLPFELELDIGLNYTPQLIEMNDEEKKSFAEIADWIEENV